MGTEELTTGTTAEPDGLDAGSLADDMLQVVSFDLAGEQYGVDINVVQEIILIGQITQMPQVPDDVSGLINLRGHILPIIDLRSRLGLASAEPTERSRIVVLNVAQRTVGVIVDSVNEVLRIRQNQIEPTPSGVAGLRHHYVAGLVKFESELLIFLDVDEVMAAEKPASVSPS